jgi:hypothetical protein
MLPGDLQYDLMLPQHALQVMILHVFLPSMNRTSKSNRQLTKL